ncbi:MULTISPECIES: CRISPR-associated endoribonuclease Cas6 [Butyricimonas]|uniref:CRISPR-associated endoribonuclease Cas6 n=1 Tax=Butyricimonas TaxID=574697 RepID=UPI0007FB32AB|nr:MULTISPECIES: CRISPR-associated endoribonuclease Cas6 [Butyricimonas]
MRFELILSVQREECGAVLPLNYQYELSSWIYRVLNEGNSDFGSWLHDHGYTRDKKQFKLFTFSNLQVSRYQIIGDRMEILSRQVSLVVSFYPIEAIESFVMGLFRDRHFTLGDRRSKVAFSVDSIVRLPGIEFSGTMRFKTLSPIFLDERVGENLPSRHVSPADPVFEELIHYNLLEKYRIFYQMEPSPEWQPTRVRLLSEPKAKTIAIKSFTPQFTQLKGYMCRLELTGAPELLKMAYYAGLGRINSQGFGCVEVY